MNHCRVQPVTWEVASLFLVADSLFSRALFFLNLLIWSTATDWTAALRQRSNIGWRGISRHQRGDLIYSMPGGSRNPPDSGYCMHLVPGRRTEWILSYRKGLLGQRLTCSSERAIVFVPRIWPATRRPRIDFSTEEVTTQLQFCLAVMRLAESARDSDSFICRVQRVRCGISWSGLSKRSPQ